MYGFLLEMFWSKKEIICFLIAVSIYITNKFGVSRIIYIPFLNNHLNDIIGGYVFATILIITHRFWLRREIKVQIYFLFIVLASIYWEYIAPLYLSYSVKDAKDIAAYLAGGWGFWVFIKKKGEKSIVTKDEVLAQLVSLEKKPLIYSGLGACAKDLCSILKEGEIVEGVMNACDRNVGHLFKGGKAIRSYLVSTNERVLLIERGQMIANMIRALDKTICIPKSDILHIKTEPISGVNKVYYFSVLTIMTNEKLYEFYITGKLEEYIPKGLLNVHTNVNKEEKENDLEKTENLSEEVSLFCRQCGMKLNGAWKACPKCGTSVIHI